MNNYLRRLGLENINNISVKNQLFRIRLALLLSFAVAFAGIIGVYILSRFSGTSLSQLTRDPSTVSKSRFYIGILSNFGIMLWAAATAICFFGVFLLMDGNNHHQFIDFLFLSGIFSLILTLDDAFLIHETVLPDYFGIPEIWVFLGYFIIGAGYLLYFFRRILNTDYLLLALSLLFFGLSIFMDIVFPYSNLETFVEDSFKFLGIVFWLAYFSRVTLNTVYDRFLGRLIE